MTIHPSRNGTDLYADSRELARARMIALVVLAIGAGVDIALAKQAFDVALRLPEAWSWFNAIGFGLVALAGAYASGAFIRSGAPRAGNVTLVVPALIAAALFVLRAFGWLFQPPVVGFEGSAPSTSDDHSSELVLAIVMLMAFIATSILAFFDGYRLTHPERSRFVVLTRQLRRTTRQQAAKRGRVARLAEELVKHVAVLMHIDADRDNALVALEALADELQEWARLEVVRALAHPVATSAIHAEAPRATTSARTPLNR